MHSFYESVCSSVPTGSGVERKIKTFICLIFQGGWNKLSTTVICNPKLKTQHTSFSVICSSGYTSNQRVKRSITINQYLKDWDGGNGPIISMWTVWMGMKKVFQSVPVGQRHVSLFLIVDSEARHVPKTSILFLWWSHKSFWN